MAAVLCSASQLYFGTNLKTSLWLAISLWLITPTPANAGEDPYPTLRHHYFSDAGVEREFFVHVPREHDGPLPVVLALHGYNSTATGFAAYHGLAAHADANGYIVVVPQGTHFVVESVEGAYRVTSWNMLGKTLPDVKAGPQCLPDASQYPCPPDCGECHRCTWVSCGDDLGYFERLLDELAQLYSIDLSRIYLLGVSNGGMMALTLGCFMPERFAAIAPIIGQMPAGYQCTPQAPLPMLHLSGAKDRTVPPDGSAASDGFIYTSVADTVADWAGAMACKLGPNRWQSAASQAVGLDCLAWSECSVSGHPVVMCSDPGGAHDWPGKRPGGPWPTCVTSQQSIAMPEQPRCAPRSENGPHLGLDLVWEFFSHHQRDHD